MILLIKEYFHYFVRNELFDTYTKMIQEKVAIVKKNKENYRFPSIFITYLKSTFMFLGLVLEIGMKKAIRDSL